MLRIRPTMKMGIPLATSPMMMMVISSVALRARFEQRIAQDQEKQRRTHGNGKVRPRHFRRADHPYRIGAANTDGDDQPQTEQHRPPTQAGPGQFHEVAVAEMGEVMSGNSLLHGARFLAKLTGGQKRRR